MHEKSVMLFAGTLFIAIAAFWVVLDPVIQPTENLLGRPTTSLDVYAVAEYNDVAYVTATHDTALHVAVNLEGSFIYKTGYFEENDSWVPFTFSEQPARGEWIRDNATATVNVSAPGNVIVMVCLKNGSDVACGPGHVDPSWTLVPYNGTSCASTCETGAKQCGSSRNFDGVGPEFGTNIMECRVIEGCNHWIRTLDCEPGLCRNSTCV